MGCQVVVLHYRFHSIMLLSNLCSCIRFAGNAKYVIKMDDNALINFRNLKIILQHSTVSHATDMDILCPSPIRNMKPYYYSDWAGYDTVAGKWSIKPHEFAGRVFPDYCLGFFYMLTPKLAGILALKSGNFTYGRKIVRLEDIFLTGIVRSQIKETCRVISLSENSPLGEKVFECPLMAGLKNILFNEIVIRKNNYVNLPGLWFNFKAFIEIFVVAPMVYLMSDIFPRNSPVVAAMKYLLSR